MKKKINNNTEGSITITTNNRYTYNPNSISDLQREVMENLQNNSVNNNNNNSNIIAENTVENTKDITEEIKNDELKTEAGESYDSLKKLAEEGHDVDIEIITPREAVIQSKKTYDDAVKNSEEIKQTTESVQQTAEEIKKTTEEVISSNQGIILKLRNIGTQLLTLIDQMYAHIAQFSQTHCGGLLIGVACVAGSYILVRIWINGRPNIPNPVTIGTPTVEAQDVTNIITNAANAVTNNNNIRPNFTINNSFVTGLATGVTSAATVSIGVKIVKIFKIILTYGK